MTVFGYLISIEFLCLLLRFSFDREDVSNSQESEACRAETGRFPLQIKAQCRTFKFWLTLAKHEENNCYKLSQVAYNDIKRIKDKVSWSQKIKNFLYHIGLGNL